MIHRFVRRGLAAAGAMAAFASSSQADAYCLTTTCAAPSPPPGCARDPVLGCWTTGAPLHWEQQCVSYSVVGGGVPNLGIDDATAQAIVASAFALWPNVACGDHFPSIAVQATAEISCNRPEINRDGPNANAVIFRSVDWPHDPTAFGLTTVTFEPSTGKILDADIEINTYSQPLTALSLEYVVAHEAGHFLGIDHSNNTAALMFPSYSPFDSDNEPALAYDDQVAICQTYFPLRPVPPGCDPEPEHGFAPECGGNVYANCGVARPGGPKPATSAGLSSLLLLLIVRVRRASGAGRGTTPRGKAPADRHPGSATGRWGPRA